MSAGGRVCVCGGGYWGKGAEIYGKIERNGMVTGIRSIPRGVVTQFSTKT